MHGEGTITYADGSKFKGTFEQGRKHGKAVETDANGKRLECIYVEGERDGAFYEYDAHGTLIAKGIFQQGRRKEQ